LSVTGIFTLIAAIILIWLALRFHRRYQQKKLAQTPLPSHWLKLLQEKVSIYSLLPDALQKELHGHIQLFLNEKEFIGQGIEITDEIKLTIAGSACILLLQGEKRSFPEFTSIIVYPDTYMATQTHHDGLAEHQEYSARAGESWVRGPIVLSWKDVERGSRHSRDGRNVVLHEFAHKLDEQNNVMDGLPLLKDKTDYAEWTRVFRKEYADLIKRADSKKNKVLDKYGTVSPPEFFAVATESFFEKSKKMKRELPDLYAQLSKFYGMDPATWKTKA